MNPLRNLRRRPARTALTTAGVAIAIIMLVVMLSIGAGMKESAAKLVYDSGVDLFVTAEGGNVFTGGSLIYNGTEMAEEMKENNSKIRGIVVALSDISLFVSNGTSGRENVTTAYFTGSQADRDAKLRGYEIVEGKNMPHEYSDPFRNSTYYREGYFTPEALNSSEFTHECMISLTLARKLGVGVGDEITVGNSPEMNHSMKLRVYGIFTVSFESKDTKQVILHLSEFQYFLGMRGDPVNIMYVDLYNPSDASEVKEWIEENYPLSATSREEFVSQINRFLDMFEGFSMMISATTVLVGMIFISTIMNIAIRERRREIAAMRAIGISGRTIVKEIFLEGIAITLIAFIIGVVFGILIAVGLDVIFSGTGNLPKDFHLTKISVEMLLEVFLISMGIGILSSIAPARWSTRINISRALRGD